MKFSLRRCFWVSMGTESQRVLQPTQDGDQSHLEKGLEADASPPRSHGTVLVTSGWGVRGSWRGVWLAL